MGDFIDKLRLAEKAAEDIYFAKVNRELIESLHKRMQPEESSPHFSEQSNVEGKSERQPCVEK